LLALVLATGCSAFTVSNARTTRTKAIVCESSWISPAIDTAIALTGVALIIWGATKPDHDPNRGDGEDHGFSGRDIAMYPGFALALPFASSAMYGYSEVATCKRAERPAPAFAFESVETVDAGWNTVGPNTESNSADPNR
jgi:hypothetical protein